MRASAATLWPDRLPADRRIELPELARQRFERAVLATLQIPPERMIRPNPLLKVYIDEKATQIPFSPRIVTPIPHARGWAFSPRDFYGRAVLPTFRFSFTALRVSILDSRCSVSWQHMVCSGRRTRAGNGPDRPPRR
jgi:hypothetical protein